jgi:general secretion pathway protein B
MSYILEALRKADAERERERGSVPDLHAQLLPPGVSDAEVAPPRSSSVLWVGLGAGLVAVAGVAWYLLGRDESAAAAAPLTPIAAAPAAAPPPPVAAVPVVVPVVPLVASAPSALAAPPAPVLKPEPTAPKALAKPKPAAAVPVPTAEPMPAPPPQRVPPLAELPAELRQQVPPLAVGGSVYSPQASARMVVINGQVFQEGSSLGPELKLEQVRPKTAVLSIRGQRFELPL